ncbi:putative reverse transcriptase domain-containing protein [Tanacetum coccineum]
MSCDVSKVISMMENISLEFDRVCKEIRRALELVEWEVGVREQYLPKFRLRGGFFETSTCSFLCPFPDDPYVQARNAAIADDDVEDDDVEDEDDMDDDAADPIDDEVAKALAADRATRNTTGVGGSGNVGGAGNAGGPERAQPAKDYECTFGISECAERNKVKFATITLQGCCQKSFVLEEEISELEDKLRHMRLKDNDIGETYSSKPTTLNEAVRMAHGLMEHKIQGWNEINAEQNKRKWEGGNQGLIKVTAITIEEITVTTSGGNAPKCNRCNMFHFGNFLVKCNKCGKRGHFARDYHGKGVATGDNAEPIRACFKCGDPNHLANSDLCLERKKQGSRNASGHVYAVRDSEQAQGPNVVTGTFLLNNRYFSILFDSGSNKSFINTSLTHLFDIEPERISTSYEVELADGRIVSTNTVLKGCTLNLVNHLFKIDLMPIELGTFDVIIGMDWLVALDAVVARKYIERGCHLFLAHVTEKEKSEKRLEDVPVIRDFPEVFPDDLPGLPLPRQVEFKIDLNCWRKDSFTRARHPGELRVSLTPRSRRGYPHHRFSNEIWSLRIPSNAVWSNQCTDGVHGFNESVSEEKFYSLISKCDFWLESVQFLGHVISSEGVHIDPSKIEAIKIASPTSPTEVRQFMGLVRYYRRFIKGFSLITKPHTKLTQKNKKFEWDADEDEAFQKIKQDLCTTPILALLEGPDDFVVYCHASLRVMCCLPNAKDSGKSGSIVEAYLRDPLQWDLVKAEHQRPSGLLQQPEIPEWKLEHITMDFVTGSYENDCGYDVVGIDTSPLVEFFYNNSLPCLAQGGHRLKALYGEQCRIAFCWSEVGDSQLTGSELIHETRSDIQIKNRLLTARSRQKSYADVRRKPMEFDVGNMVMLKVSPWKGVIRFGKRGKLSLRYVGPFKIIARMVNVLMIRVNGKIRSIHNTFHVSNLKKCLADENLVIPLREIQLDDKLHFIEEPVEIMDREVKQLKQSRILIVKVRWNSRRGPEFTWEREDFFMRKYPHLFPSKKRRHGDNRATGRRSRKEGTM